MACLQYTNVGSRPMSRVREVCKPIIRTPLVTCRPIVMAPRTTVVTRSQRNSDASFVAGFVLGGVVFGALGFLFAPQLSKALLGDDQRLKLPRFLEDEQPKDPEATKQELIDKIAQLNASIDEVASQLKPKDEALPTAVERESVAINN